MNDPQSEGQMASYIGRRKFFATLGGVAVAWPRAARAQQAKIPRSRFLRHCPSSAYADPVEPRRAGLRQLGYIEGQNITIELGPDEGQQAPMQDADLLANCPPDNEQRLDQHGQIGKVRDKLPDARLELDRPDHANLETEVAQGGAQVILDGNRLRLK